MFSRLKEIKVSPRVVYWIAVGMLIAFMFIPREYAFAQSAENAGGLPTTFPYTKTFVITGYYSPLPDQSFYITGSYESDKRLNGNGTNGADGTQVYPGMIAAPKEFAFGTKMKVPGIGTVAVHDRGGAIKTNRLDLWLGKGEPGLARALAWGKRTVEVTVYGIDPSIAEVVSIDTLPMANLSRVRVATATTTAPQKVYKDLAYGESGEDVRLMQEYLSLLGFYKDQITGYFGETTQSAVIEFQTNSNIIANPNEAGAGVFGPKTRDTFESQLEKNRVEDLASIPTETLYTGKSGDEVNKLNYLLSEFGYLQESHAQATRFDKATEDALIRMQLDLGIIKNDKDSAAGVFGPKTQQFMKKLVENRWNPGSDLRLEPGEASANPFTAQLNPGETSANILELQRMLRDLHFLNIEPSGYYGETTKHAVFKFQQSFGIVTTMSDDGAGVVGPKTLTQLNQLAVTRNDSKKLIGTTTDTSRILASRLSDEKVLVSTLSDFPIVFTEHATYGFHGDTVEQLQKILKQLGFFDGKVTTDYYGDMTKKAVIAFQKNHSLPETGDFDEQTRVMLNKLVE